jgi:hypothetical protein
MFEIVSRQEAKAKGFTHYFTGEMCKNGHIDKRYVKSRACFSCSKIKQQKLFNYRIQYRLKNKERISKQKHEDYMEKKEYYSLYHSEYYRKNKERKSNYHRDLYKKQREKRLEYIKKYRIKNSVRYHENAIRRKKHIKAATPKWVSISSILIKYKERKIMTQLTGVEYHVDHIVPLRNKNVSGLHVPWNLRVIPAKDNLYKKNNLPPEEQLRYRGQFHV